MGRRGSVQDCAMGYGVCPLEKDNRRRDREQFLEAGVPRSRA